jgi:hypothetical protein
MIGWPRGKVRDFRLSGAPPEKETLKPPTCCWVWVCTLKLFARSIYQPHSSCVHSSSVHSHTTRIFYDYDHTSTSRQQRFFSNLNSLSSSYFKMRSTSGPAYRHPSQAHLPVSRSKPRFMFLRTPSAMFSTFNIIRASIYCTFISSAQYAKLIAMISPCIPMEYHLLGHRGSLPERTQCLRSQ